MPRVAGIEPGGERRVDPAAGRVDHDEVGRGVLPGDPGTDVGGLEPGGRTGPRGAVAGGLDRLLAQLDTGDLATGGGEVQRETACAAVQVPHGARAASSAQARACA